MICLAKYELMLPASWLRPAFHPRSRVAHSECGQF